MWKSLLRNQVILERPFKIERSAEEIREVLELAIRKIVYDRQRLYAGEYLEQIMLTAKWLTDSKMSGLYLCGVVGCGKTTLLNAMRMVVNAYLSMPDNRANPVKGFVLYDAVGLTKLLTNSAGFGAVPNDCVLGIDDLGTEAIETVSYGNVTRPIVELLSGRYERRERTVITSNLTPGEIESRYGKRLADRFREEYVIVNFPNGSFRVNG